LKRAKSAILFNFFRLHGLSAQEMKSPVETPLLKSGEFRTIILVSHQKSY